MPKQRMIDSYALMANRLRTESQAKCFNDKRDCHLWSVVTLKLGETNFSLAAIHMYLWFQRNCFSWNRWNISCLVNERIVPLTPRIILKIVGFQILVVIQSLLKGFVQGFSNDLSVIKTKHFRNLVGHVIGGVEWLEELGFCSSW